MIRSGAATTAHGLSAGGGKGGRGIGKGFRPQGEHGALAFQARQPSIGLNQYRHRTLGQKIGCGLGHFNRAGAAVHADEVHSQVGQRGHAHGHGRPRKGDAGLVSHGNGHGQAAHPAGRHHGGTGFGQVELGFNHHQVCAACGQAANLFFKGSRQGFKVQLAQRFKEFTRGAHAAGHEHGPAGLGGGVVGSLARHGRHAPVEIKRIQRGGQL